ncbi:MAG: ribonuclease P protein component [Prevotellaceae bacterium]|nr:ribonuclease P protein component [Prevotellaceae bacterium]
MEHSAKFPKSEHLCGAKNLTRLFEQGNAFIAYPLRVLYLQEASGGVSETLRVVVVVPKKRFKRAVDRNRLKRLMREAYRLNKPELLTALKENGKQMLLAFHYVADNKMEFADVERKMKIALKRIIGTVNGQVQTDSKKND